MTSPRAVAPRYDVIVAGFGTAGAPAAIAAAERGLRVLALEMNTYPGGTFTGGFIPAFYQQGPSRMMAELDTASNAAAAPDDFTPGMVEQRKRMFEDRARAAGVDIRYGARASGVDLRDGRVAGLRWCWEEGGEASAETDIVIDATAEAEVCRLAGCPLSAGRDADGRFQPYTHTFLFSRGRHVFGGNCDAGYLAQNDPDSFSRDILRSAAGYRWDYTADHRPVMPADLMGVREGPRIVGRQVATLRALLDGPPDDAQPIDYAYTNIDTHAMDLALEDETLNDWLVGASMWGQNLWIPVPLWTMFPRGVKGLVVAGRHLSVDHDLGHALRMNPLMANMGETAGILAAHALRGGVAPDDVAYADIKGELRLPASPLAENEALWNLSDAAIRDGLASDRPGFAQWSARRRGAREWVTACWRKAASDPEGPLRRHAAMTLALLGDDAGVDDLLAMVRVRDPYVPATSRNYNHARGYASIYLLGRLRAVRAIDTLADALAHPGDGMPFRVQTFALMALAAIGDAHPAARGTVAAALRAFAEDPARRLVFPFKNSIQLPRPFEGDFTDAFRQQAASALDRWGMAHAIVAASTSIVPRVP